jgi:hypothetical protein
VSADDTDTNGARPLSTEAIRSELSRLAAGSVELEKRMRSRGTPSDTWIDLLIEVDKFVRTACEAARLSGRQVDTANPSAPRLRADFPAAWLALRLRDSADVWGGPRADPDAARAFSADLVRLREHLESTHQGRHQLWWQS